MKMLNYHNITKFSAVFCLGFILMLIPSRCSVRAFFEKEDLIFENDNLQDDQTTAHSFNEQTELL